MRRVCWLIRCGGVHSDGITEAAPVAVIISDNQDHLMGFEADPRTDEANQDHEWPA
jgi:hypothetical protein